MQANVKAAVFSDEAERVDALVRLAHEYGGAALRAEVGFIVEGATSKRAAVAVLGQFKRGKSMLVNALLGNNILPIGKLPLTGVPTRVLYGEPALVVCYLDGRKEAAKIESLPAHVTEALNPGNVLGVAYVDVTYPSEFLRDIILIDTPGIGSTLQHNTASAHELSDKIDYALFVTGPEPPITGEELAFLREVQGLVERVTVVISKIDLVRGSESEIVDFIKRTIHAELADDFPIYTVDATVPDNGVDDLRDHIIRSIAENNRGTVQRSLARRIQRAGAGIRRIIEIQRAAALLPELERREARNTFARLAEKIMDRGADIIRAMDRFPDEEMGTVDALLNDLVHEGERALSASVASFVTRGHREGEGDLYAWVAEWERGCFEHVSELLNRRVKQHKNVVFVRAVELENDFIEVGAKSLGMRLSGEVATTLPEFEAREVALPILGSMPTTGLEVLTESAIAMLPPPFRVPALRRRFASIAPRLLDRSRGRTRAAALRYLLDWRFAYGALLRDRLAAACDLVERAFERVGDTDNVNNAEVTEVVDRLNRDERELDGLLARYA